MKKDECGTVWVYPLEDQLDVKKEKLMDIIDRLEKLPVYETKRYIGPPSDSKGTEQEKQFNQANPKNWITVPADEEWWRYEAEDEADVVFREMLGEWEKRFDSQDVALNSNFNYEHTDPRSIRWEVFNKLRWAVPKKLKPADLSMLKEFLNTPPGKELEAWEKWEAYWENRELNK